jgi:hypothetical protein
MRLLDYKFTGHPLRKDSPLKNNGLDLKSIFETEYPAPAFFGNPVAGGYATEPGICQIK